MTNELNVFNEKTTKYQMEWSKAVQLSTLSTQDKANKMAEFSKRFSLNGHVFARFRNWWA